MENNNRFSVMLLEKDVLEYHNYKTKYNEFYEKCKICSFEEKEDLERKKDYWYKRYIKKMKYLEENYRKTNIYTNYHAQLENRHVTPESIPMAIAEPVIQSHSHEEPCQLPSAPTHRPIIPSAPRQQEEEEYKPWRWRKAYNS